jgi:hypothetical protein
MDERETTPSARRAGSGREMGALVLRSAGAALLLVWAVWITYLFLGGPPGGKAAPLPTSPPSLTERLFHTAGHYENAGHLTRLSMVYRDLLSPKSWNWRVGAEDWLVLAIGLLGLALMTLIGYQLVSCFEVYIPRGAAVPVWFAMGVGLCGVVYTFVALAGLLYQWVAWVVLVAMAGVLAVFARRARRQAGGWRQEAGGKKASGFQPLDSDLRPIASGLQPAAYIWFRPRGIVERPLAWVMAALIALITAFTFYWAAFYPETYWDALILYLGYARGMFLEHKFPLKVVGQVGVGLGANYPHLFELTGATIATWANHWSPRYLQIATPLAGLMSLLLAYHTVLRLSRSVFLALLAALLIRSAPYWITYSTWTSNYSFVVLYSAVFFYLALRYIEDGLPGYFILATLTVAFSMHINYLMGSLWVCWAAMVVLAHWPRRLSSPLSPQAIPTQHSLLSTQHSVLSPQPSILSTQHSALSTQSSVLSPQSSVLSPQPSVLNPQSSILGTQHSALSTPPSWPGLGGFLRSGRFWTALAWGMALSSIWYVRNWIVTGNPVYAFFPKLFPGTKHLNPEVMLSAYAEWQSNGDGIGIAGPGLLDRLLFTWPYFVNNPNTCYKWAPVFIGVVVPGVLIFLALVLWQALAPRYEDETGRRVRTLDDASRLGLVALLYMGILFVYHYAMGPFYMYHLFGCFAVFSVFVYYALRSCPRPLLWLFGAWAVFAALMPGLPWAIMGPAGNPRLTALRNPGMPQRDFYDMKYGDEVKMWDKVNALCRNTALLTHENRAMLFDPSVKLVHMDDWELQQVWGKPSAARLETLKGLGVRYYLQVPMERKHAINARLGHGEWLTDGTLEKVFEAGGDVLYRFHYPGER